MLASPTGCYAGPLAVSEGVSKSKESVHTYVEGPVVGESKYGLTVSTEDGTLATRAALLLCGWVASYDKTALNT